MQDFNPRTREGCDEDFIRDAYHPFNFNPRTREGCDAEVAGKPNAPRTISIHAPVKGATFRFHRAGLPFRYFNPRTREGCDSVCVPVISAFSLISIHAPVKGATPE